MYGSAYTVVRQWDLHVMCGNDINIYIRMYVCMYVMEDVVRGGGIW